MRQLLKTAVGLLGLSVLTVQAGELDKFQNVGGNPAGSVTDNGNGSYTLRGGGNDIWATRDEFGFAYTEVIGDFDVKVRAESVQTTATWPKFGVMARETLAEDSRYFFNRVSPGGTSPCGAGGVNDWRVMYRTGMRGINGESGGEHEELDGANTLRSPTFPNSWLRIVRVGDTFYASNSSDGINWQFMLSQNTANWFDAAADVNNPGPMPSRLWLGLAGSRHPDAGGCGIAYCTGEFREFDLKAQFASSRGNPLAVYVRLPRAIDPVTGTTLANFGITGPGSPAIQSVALSPNSAKVVILSLSSTTPLQDYTTAGNYTVTVNGVNDTAGTSFGSLSLTLQHGLGYEARKIHITHTSYRGIPGDYNGTTVGELHQGSVRDGMPPVVGNNLFEDPKAQNTYTGTEIDNYGGMIFGILQPVSTRSYKFACASDDNGVLYLSTDDNPANRFQIAAEPGWSGVRTYATDNGGSRGSPPANKSAAYTLQAGKKYYLRYVYQQGGGGFNASASWDNGTGAAFVDGQSPIDATNFAASRWFVGQVFYTLGKVSIAQAPQSRTNQDATFATFSVKPDGTPPYTYQWRKNNALISGANAASYITPRLLPEDNLSKFDCIVANEFSSITSAAAFLTVTVDLVPPTLVSVIGDSLLTNIYLRFSESVTAASAQEILNYSVTDASGNALTVLSAKLAADGTNVVLTTVPPAENTRYTVTVNNIQDASSHNNPIAANSQLAFTSWMFTPGFLKMQVYDVGGGNDLSLLTNNALFPNTVRETYYVPGFSSRWAYNDNGHEAYGARISGFFIPPVSGDYNFYVSGDDGHGLWINPAGASFNGLVKYIDSGAGCCQPYTSEVTPALPMTAGQRYAIQGAYKEGGGGDYIGVWVKLASDPTAPPASPDASGAGSELKGAPGKFFGTYANPDVAPVITLVQPLVDISKSYGSKAVFTVLATNSTRAAQFYLWYTNGVLVTDSNAASYVTPRVSADMEGMTVTVQVYVPGRVAVSSAVLHTYPDLIPPTIEVAWGFGSLTSYGTTTNFDLVFSEELDGAFAQELLNFFPIPRPNGSEASITAATLDADGRTIHCVTDLPVGDGSQVTVENIPDLAGNIVVDGTVTLFVNWGFAREDFYAGFGGVTINDLTNNAVYPNSPTEVHWQTAFESHCVDCADTYGQRLSGWLRVPTSGNYTFWTSSDDASTLYLSTDENPANRAPIAWVNGWSSTKEYNKEANQKSAPIALQAGKKYYIEALMKEDGGGDNLGVTMNTNGVAVNGDAAIPGMFLSPASYLRIDPASPADVTINQCYPVAETLKYVALPRPMNIGINWFADVNKDGTFEWVNSGATISLPAPIPLELDGVQFYAVITNEWFAIMANELSYAMSRVATLHVLPTSKPVLLGASSVAPMTIGVMFDKPVDRASGGEALNYRLIDAAGNPILSPDLATVRPDGQTVILNFSTAIPSPFKLQADGISDCVGLQQIDPTEVSGVQWASSMDIPAPVAPNGGTNFSWQVNEVEITAGGADIWDVADQFHFVYNRVDGDFDVKVLVDRFDAPNRWAKAGLMARMALEPSSPTIQLNSTPGPRVGGGSLGESGFIPDYTGSETETGVRSDWGAGTGGWEAFRPITERSQTWLRLQRAGTVFNGFYSVNGIDWTKFAGPTVQAFGTNSALYVGFNDCSHNTSVAAPAHFAHFGTTAYPNGAISLVTAPEAVTITNANFSAILTAKFAVTGSIPGTEPVTIRWQRNDGAGNWLDVSIVTKFAMAEVETSYTTPALTFANDDGAQYRVIANVVSYRAESDIATIVLLEDFNPPSLTYAVSLNPSNVAVFFDKSMSTNGAQATWWTVTGPTAVTVAGVALDANAKRYNLVLDASTPLQVGGRYTVAASANATPFPALGVSDVAGNAVSPNPVRASFVALGAFPDDPNNITILPTDNALSPLLPTDQKLRGFDCRIVQTLANILGAVNDNDLAELVLSGMHPQQGANIAGMPCFVENNVINYNWELNNLGQLIPDLPIPGVRISPLFNSDNFVFEALTYLDLKAGIYRLGVNSDDGFRVTPATSQADPHNGTVLGQFNGGRGSSDTWFEIYAPQDGLYPVRLMWEEGGGGANCEFLVYDLVTGEVKGVNAQGAIAAYRPTYSPIIHSTVPATASFTLSPTDCTYVVPDFTGLITFTNNDRCGGTASVGQVPPAGTLLGPGHHTIAVGAMSQNWASNGVSVALTVTDPNAPVILNATNAELLCQGGGATVDFYYITVADCDPNTTLTLSVTNGTFLPVGVYPVTTIATDTSGNSTTNSFTLSVVDPLPPTITCPADMTVSCVLGATAVQFDVASSSVCDLDAPPVVCTPPSGSVFQPGQTTVHCVATALSGRTAECSFKVNVVLDTVPPQLAGCPADVVVQAETNTAAAPFVTPTATDNCTATVPVVCSPPAGGDFQVGETTVQCVATDASGNSASCSFKVTVLAPVPPRALFAVSLNQSNVAVYFDKHMSALGADAIYWGLSGPGASTVASVSLNANSRRYDLFINPPMEIGSNYTVTASADGADPAVGVTDLLGKAANPNPVTLPFVALANFPDNPDSISLLATDNVLPTQAGEQMLRGFDCRMVQSALPILSTGDKNDLGDAEKMLAGTYPGQGANTAGLPKFVETGIINYNWETTFYGHIQPDKPIPGLVQTGPATVNIAMEALAYVSLKQGVYRFGVNSDDGFRVTSGTSATDPQNSRVWGQFNGGRGASDSWFDIYAPQDGLYPVRLIWENGQGGANVEFTLYDLITGAVTAINADDSIAAFRTSRTPVQGGVFASEFTYGKPSGATLTGSAIVDAGVLKLTTAANGQVGNFFLPDITGGQPITNYSVSFNLALGGGTCCGDRMADGMSFVMGSDLTAASVYAEDGCCNGITVTFDTWDNAAPDTAPAIEVKVAGTVVAFQSMSTLGGAVREGGRAPDGPVLTNALGGEVSIFTFGPSPATPVFVPVTMELFADNTFSLSFSNVVVWDHLPLPYTRLSGVNWGFGARTGGANEAAFVDNLQIYANSAAGPAFITVQPADRAVIESQVATFDVQADGTPAYFFQWYSNGVAIAGANAQSYTTPPTTLGMNGTLYSVAISNALSGGVAVMSRNALLTVNPVLFAQSVGTGGRPNGVVVRFSKNARLVGTYTLNNGVTVSSVAYGATHQDVVLMTSTLTPDTDYALTVAGEVGEDGSPLVPNPSVVSFHHGFGRLCTDFTSLPAGTALFNNGVSGAAQLGDDGTGNTVVHLTDDGINGAYGKLFIYNRVGSTVLKELRAQWRTKIGGDLGGHADGICFNWANDLFADGNFQASEEGEGSGVRFNIDIYDNGSGPDTGIEIQWQAARIAFLHIPRTDEGNGDFICKNVFVDTSASVNSDGLATFTYDGHTISAVIPNWAGIANGAYAFSARTGGENENFWIDDLCINTFTVGPVFLTREPVETTTFEGQSATFTAAVDGSPAYHFQWLVNGVAIPGATSPSYSTAPATMADEGKLYSVVVSNEFSSVTSASVALHVQISPRVVSIFSRGNDKVHVTYTRPVDLYSGAYDFDGGLFEGTREYGSSHNEVIITTDSALAVNSTYTLTISDVADEGDPANTLYPNPTVKPFRHGFGQYCNDFSTDQAAATTVGPVTLYGSAYIAGGVLHLTDATAGILGSMVLEDQNGGLPLDRLQLRYRAYVGGGGGSPADGYSVSFGNFANAAVGGGEEGNSIGLTIAFDNYDNGGGEAPAIDVKWNGTTIAHTLTTIMRSDLLSGVPASPNFLDTYINMDPDGTLDVMVNGVVIYSNLATPWTGLTGARLAFAGRTGGLLEANWIDNLCVNGFSLGGIAFTREPADILVNENPPQTATLRVDVNGLPPYSVQWYSNDVALAGATTFVYTTVPLNRDANGAGYTAVVHNEFGSATSRVARVTVVADGAAPTLLSAVADYGTTVYVLFSEKVEAASASSPTNYSINHGIAVTGAWLDASARRVLLTVSPGINPNDCDELTINGVRDVNLYPNTILDAKIKIAAKAPIQGSGANNLIVIEAEDYDYNRSPGVPSAVSDTSTVSWAFGNAYPGYRGTGYMDVMPLGGPGSGNVAAGITNACQLDYYINFPAAGTYYAWFRGATHNNAGAQNSLHFGLDGVIPDEFTLRVGNRTNNWGATANLDDFGWVRDANGTNADSVAQIVVPTAGVHTINIWQRETGLSFDRFLLTTDPAYMLAVSEVGPVASARPTTRAIQLVPAPDGSVTILWSGTGWTLQATPQLHSNPAQTVWQTLPYPSGTVIPPGFFGFGNTNVFFRLICP